MNDNELKITKRALFNILSSMIKLQDAPCSSEMHLIESVVDLAKILDIKDFNDKEMNEQYQYCLEVLNSLRNNQINN
jgi:hypothetical protein